MKYIFLVLICFLLSSCSNETETKPAIDTKVLSKKTNQNKDNLNFTNKVEFYKNGKVTKKIKVAVARTPDERNQGLMGVTKLKMDNGMLFVFEKEQELSFWMANTPLSLDIIFVNADFKIVRIHTETEPFTTKQYESSKPAKYVIEVNGGFCVDNDILDGTEVGFDL